MPLVFVTQFLSSELYNGRVGKHLVVFYSLEGQLERLLICNTVT